MKICVYAIAKNEMKFIERWYNSVKEADYICILDTGSTDGSYEKFKELDIITKQQSYNQFRFDQARNDSMNLIPEDTDICVCCDLDEVFKPGWSKILKNNWKYNTTQARYRYTWNFNSDGSEGFVFMGEKIHKHKFFKWKNPVHEILTPTFQFKNEIIDLPQIQLDHHADETKPRSSYLPLLELSVKENPNDDRSMHYLAREYYFYHEYKKSITTFKKHLSLPSAIWEPERCASFRYMAKCHQALSQPKKQEKCLLNALLEDNKNREAYFDLGEYYFSRKDYLKSCLYFEEMLKIKTRELSYISSPECWSALPYDYLSICYHFLNKPNQSVYYASKAIELSPNDERLKNNLNLFISVLNNQPQNQNNP